MLAFWNKAGIIDICVPNPPESKAVSTLGTKSGGFLFLKSLIAMKRLKCCGKCIHFKYEDSEGYGWCDLLEEADVERTDKACVEYEEDKHIDYDYE